ncbi:MAG TPA: hypothetical protein V6C58_24425 [Allocoleopsis sp.]
MTFKISQEEEVRVYHRENLFLRADVKNGINYKLQFFKGDSLILETSSFAFILFKKVWIKEQSLPYYIESARQKGHWGFELTFDKHSIYTKQRPLKKPAYRLYLDNELIGEILNDKGITVGRHYIVKTTTEDEVMNLYLIIAFVVQFIAL